MASESYSIGIAFYKFNNASRKDCLVRVLEYASPRVHCGVVFFVNNQLLPYDVSAWVGRACGASVVAPAPVHQDELQVLMCELCVFAVTPAVFCSVYREICVPERGQGAAGGALPHAGIAYPKVGSIIHKHVLTHLKLGTFAPTPNDSIQCAQYCLAVIVYLLERNSSTADPALLAPFASLRTWGHGLTPELLFQTTVGACPHVTCLRADTCLRLQGYHAALPLSQLHIPHPAQLTLMYDFGTTQLGEALPQ
jgi:hypothetical protein